MNTELTDDVDEPGLGDVGLERRVPRHALHPRLRQAEALLRAPGQLRGGNPAALAVASLQGGARLHPLAWKDQGRR